MFTFVRLAGIVVYPSIFTAMVQVDNNLRTGLFLAPWAFVGMFFFVGRLAQGMIEAGRLPADAPVLVEADQDGQGHRGPAVTCERFE